MSVTGAVADAPSRGSAQRGTVRDDAMVRGGAMVRDDAVLRGGAMLQGGAVLRDDAAVRAR
ncbi:hypothetical protein AB0B54_19125 [Microbispora bryophytorum]|uniref:hypothetical protein n=1 Tax=Microbispora bryophytorum TaxID=1460882 RepID=UPI00340C9538